MNVFTAMSQADPGSAGPVRAVSVDTTIVSHLHTDHIGGLRELTGSELLVSAAEWAELATPAPELRGFLNSHIQRPGLKWHQVSLEPTDDPALAPLPSRWT